MRDNVIAWVVRVVWAAAPFVLWPTLAAGLKAQAGAVRTTAAIGAWAVWAVVLLATLVPRPAGLTLLRAVVAGAGAAAVAGMATGHPKAWMTGAALAWSVVATAVTFLPETGALFVNGGAYANERRFLLRPPGPLLLGPLQLAWGSVVALPTAAILLLAGGHWVAGGAATAASAPALWYLGRSLHGLHDRWVVFVPAGVVIHDGMSLAEPVLFRRQQVDRIQPSLEAHGTDLTQRAFGLPLELRLAMPVDIGRITSRNRRGETESTRCLLFTPTRPGAVLAEAARRRLPVAYAATTPPPTTSSPA